MDLMVSVLNGRFQLECDYDKLQDGAVFENDRVSNDFRYAFKISEGNVCFLKVEATEELESWLCKRDDHSFPNVRMPVNFDNVEQIYVSSENQIERAIRLAAMFGSSPAIALKFWKYDGKLFSFYDVTDECVKAAAKSGFNVIVGYHMYSEDTSGWLEDPKITVETLSVPAGVKVAEGKDVTVGTLCWQYRGENEEVPFKADTIMCTGDQFAKFCITDVESSYMICDLDYGGNVQRMTANECLELIERNAHMNVHVFETASQTFVPGSEGEYNIAVFSNKSGTNTEFIILQIEEIRPPIVILCSPDDEFSLVERIQSVRGM